MERISSFFRDSSHSSVLEQSLGLSGRSVEYSVVEVLELGLNVNWPRIYVADLDLGQYQIFFL